jgi:hypothetical protein
MINLTKKKKGYFNNRANRPMVHASIFHSFLLAEVDDGAMGAHRERALVDGEVTAASRWVEAVQQLLPNVQLLLQATTQMASSSSYFPVQ